MVKERIQAVQERIATVATSLPQTGEMKEKGKESLIHTVNSTARHPVTPPNPIYVPPHRRYATPPNLVYVPPNRRSAPSPSDVLHNRRSTPSPSVVPHNRRSTPSPSVVPHNRRSTPSPSVVPHNRRSNAAPNRLSVVPPNRKFTAAPNRLSVVPPNRRSTAVLTRLYVMPPNRSFIAVPNMLSVVPPSQRSIAPPNRRYIAQRLRREREMQVPLNHDQMTIAQQNRRQREKDVMSDHIADSFKKTRSTYEVGSSSSMYDISYRENQPPVTKDVTMQSCEDNTIDHDITVFDESEEEILNSHRGHALPVPNRRHFLGKMDVLCPFCSALHWKDEQLSKSRRNRPLFGTCCLQGKVKLPLLSPLPPAFKSLFEGSNKRARLFREQIRQYNVCNAFTSLGCKFNDRVLHGRGPTSFTVHGELRNQIGLLLPDPGMEPKFSQLYIYDPLAALDHRHNRNPNLSREVLKTVQETLLETHKFCDIYKQAFEVLTENASENNNVPVHLHYDPRSDRRRYNLPTTDEIAVILPGDGSKVNAMRDIVLRLRGGHELERISECHPAYLPLHYVLLFPYGDLGWSPDLKLWDVKRNAPSNARLTQLLYYAYRLFERPTKYSSILLGCKLLHEFFVDAWAAYEQNRLRYIRLNQDTIRSDVYKCLTDVALEGLSPDQIGQRFILPSSHVGSPRHMYKIFQDSMAITRHYKHPDIFLTVTANLNWQEIKDALKEHQTSTLRPEIVARVFELKRKAIMKEILKNDIFGRVVAYVYTIEFQKRGLPHMHCLLFLAHDDKIRNSEQVDKFVCAEFPDLDTHPALFETVKKCMVHGPCGDRDPSASCMENGRCTKGYPKEFVEETIMDKKGYSIYRRRDTGKKYFVKRKNKMVKVDNGDVVPYNAYLSEMFDCHINVEVCASCQAVKYINKYIYKGYDKATVVAAGTNDEIQQYIDARYIGPIEAAWHLFQNPMHKEFPSVQRLALHLEGMHRVVFNSKEPMDAILARARDQTSTLTTFFKRCDEDPDARAYTYQEFPRHYVFHKDSQEWTPRTQGPSIGRMYFASPNAEERFYLRLLLTVVKGPTSFAYLYKVGDTVYNTYKEACIARGLLEADDEWIQCLEEAAIMKTGYQLRRLFCVILLECHPLRPDLLWSKFASSICDDLGHWLRTKHGILDPTDEQITDYGLYLVEQILLESGKTLEDFPPMPKQKEDWSKIVGNRLIWEQRQLQHEGIGEEAAVDVSRLNDEQLHAYTVVTDSVYGDKGKLFFLNGAAGTGKTFLYNTIAKACRSMGLTVIMVASSGIASLLLSSGRTAHSTFKIPIDVMDTTFCGFTKHSDLADLFKETKLIVWDEVPMQHRYCVEAVDRTLQDICGNKKIFGGITTVLGGDFRQTLPVIPLGQREQFVGASLRRSFLWSYLEILHLVQNMRLEMAESENVEFADFLLEIGSNPKECVQLPNGIRKCTNIQELIFSVYPQLDVMDTPSPTFLTDRTILAARNDDVSAINEVALNLFLGEALEYLAADKIIEDDIDNPSGAHYPTEFLNSLDPSSLPPFNLKLKPGCPIMLLRNIAPKDGLCNGTRLMVLQCASKVLQAKILTGEKAGNPVLIPRISLAPSNSELPFKLSRRQFPVRLAYAMRINKSQGQSVKYVGIDLRTPVFSHGQLYVAMSRCTSSKRISVFLPPNARNCTTNVVYPEVLL